MGYNITTHELNVVVSEPEQFIRTLCKGNLANREAIKKTPLKIAVLHFYLDKLTNLNDIEKRFAELEKAVEDKRKQKT